jgi:hypothetical protein
VGEDGTSGRTSEDAFPALHREGDLDMITETHWKFTCIDGKQFPYAPSDKQSRHAAYKAAEAHTNALVAAADKAAGRRLSLRELQKMQMSHDSPSTGTGTSTGSDWAAQRLAYLREHPGETPAEKARSLRRIEHLEQLVGAAAQDAADPKIARATQHAKKLIDKYRSDPARTDDLAAAHSRLTLATDPDAYWCAVKTYYTARGKAATMADRALQISRKGEIPFDIASNLALQEAQTAEKEKAVREAKAALLN